MRIIDIIKDANGNLLRSKLRTALTIIAIFIGAMTLTITNGIGSGISTYIDKQLGNLGAEDVLVVQPKMDNSFGGGPKEYEPGQTSGNVYGGFGPTIPMLSESDIESIASVDGIVSAEPLLGAAPDYVVGPNDKKYQLTVSGFIAGTNLAIDVGSAPDNGSKQNELVLPHDYPSVLGFDSAVDAVGEQVTLAITSASGKQQEVKATIVGVQEQSLVSIGGASINDVLLRNLNAIQTEGQPAGAKDSHMAAIARVAKGTSDSEMQSIKSELAEKEYDAQTFEDQIGLFKQAINAITTVLNIFAAIALVAAGFGIVNTLLMAVQERTKEIGLMKAMGLGRGKIFLLFSVEAILLGFWGSLLGSLAGIGIGLAANQYASETFLKDLPGFNLTAFSPLSVIVIMLIIMTVSFIAGTAPARRASRKDPIEALRYE